MAKRTATVAYENQRTSRAEAKYFSEVRQRLDAMGAPNSGELLHTSRTYVEGAHRGGVGADVAAAVIWHQHCRTGVTPDKKDCGATECPAVESGAACPPENTVGESKHVVRTTGHGTYMVRVLTEDGGVIEIDNAASKESAFRDGADILETGLVMNGKRIKIKGVKVVQRGARGEEAFEAVSEARDSIPACAPFTQVVKDPQKFAACQARAKQIGPLEDDRKMYEFLRSELEKQDQEIFVVVGVDLHRNLRSFGEVARGQRDRVQVNVEDVLRLVIESGVHGFIVAHNHPSGSATPSKKDGELTETIREAAQVACPNVVFLDHIVVGAGQYYTFADRKLRTV